MTRWYRIRWWHGCLLVSFAGGIYLIGGAEATAVPYPLPPGYFSSYDQGYNTMAPLAGAKYHFTLSSPVEPACYDELRIAQSGSAPEVPDGFIAGCIDAARHAVGIYFPCDRFGDDPVCPRRP